MIELLLVLSLLGNGAQFYDRGGLEHSNEQLQQVVVEKDNLIGRHYVELDKIEAQLSEAESAREEIFARSEERAIELEKLRNRSVGVADYLNETIPSELVEHLQTYSTD